MKFYKKYIDQRGVIMEIKYNGEKIDEIVIRIKSDIYCQPEVYEDLSKKSVMKSIKIVRKYVSQFIQKKKNL